MLKARPKSKKLSSANIAEIEEAKYHHQLKKMEVFNRAFYIYQCIAKELGKKLSSNWKIDAEDEDMIEAHIEDMDNIWDFRPNPLESFYNKHGGDNWFAIIGKDEWSFENGEFPARWLFEDFEEELAEGVKKYKDKYRKEKEQEEKELQRSKELRKNRAKIIQSVKKKLTMEEIEVVFGSKWQP